MCYMNAAVICYQPHRLAAGDRFELRYRIVVHPGHWDAERLQQEYQRYLEQARQFHRIKEGQ